MRRHPLCERLLRPWIAERCVLGRDLFESAGALYDDWRTYARREREEPGSTPEFAAAMESRGFPCDRLAGERTRIRWGLRLRPSAPRGSFPGGGG